MRVRAVCVCLIAFLLQLLLLMSQKAEAGKTCHGLVNSVEFLGQVHGFVKHHLLTLPSSTPSPLPPPPPPSLPHIQRGRVPQACEAVEETAFGSQKREGGGVECESTNTIISLFSGHCYTFNCLRAGVKNNMKCQPSVVPPTAVWRDLKHAI